jgi:predicted AAA+ superfamily ATPase
MEAYYAINGWPFHDDLIYDYLKWGGFPLRFDYNDEESIHRYLSNLYESIVNRDIIGKRKSEDKKSFLDVSLYILANAGKEFSIDNIIEAYKKNNKTISKRTVYNYLEKMKKAYLIHGVGRYNIVGKAALSNREKQYAIDMGFRTINTNTINYEDTFFLENIIYNELLVRGYTVFAGKTYKGEIDFVAIKEGKKCFIQVTYYMAQESTIKREFGAYSPITDSSPKYVMSLDRVDLSQNGVAHINIVDFLLGKKDIFLT